MLFFGGGGITTQSYESLHCETHYKLFTSKFFYTMNDILPECDQLRQ